jgi:hypothetical protein
MAFPGGLSKISLSWGREASLAKMRVVKTMVGPFDPYSPLPSQKQLDLKTLRRWIARNVKPHGEPLGKSGKKAMETWLEKESGEEVDYLARIFESLLSAMPGDSPPKPRQPMDVIAQRNQHFPEEVKERQRQLQEAIDELKASCVRRVIFESGANTASERRHQLEAIDKLGCINNLGGIGAIAPCGHHVEEYEHKVYSRETAIEVAAAKRAVDALQAEANYWSVDLGEEGEYDHDMVTRRWCGDGPRPVKGHCYDCTAPGCEEQISRFAYIALHYQAKKVVYDKYQQELVKAMNHVDQEWEGVQEMLAAIGARYLATRGAE